MQQTITSTEQLSSIVNNKIVGTSKLQNTKINFIGSGNILYCEEGVRLNSSSIEFKGNNSVVMLGTNKHEYKIGLSVHNNCSIIIGRNVYFNGCLHAIASEECSIIIGDNCLFSFNIWIRNADPHLVYDINSHERINYSQDVIIGDHVWIGQSSIILKKTAIGSGSVIGAMGLVAGKNIPSNEVWAGNPVQCIRSNIFWEGSCVHDWTSDKTARFARWETDEFVFCKDEHTLTESFIPSNKLSPEEKLNYYLSVGYDKRQHNRLFVGKN